MAIIIDDIGYNINRGIRAINLPGSLTYAVLPNSPYAELLSENAHQSKKEVIVHLPMSNLIGHPLGPGGLTESLSENEFLAAVAAAIKKVPHASGLNNHTGSYLTQQIQQMNWLMEDIKRRNFFFVDSRTTPKSVAHKVARRKQILTSGRDVFLDNDPSFFEIDRAFHRLIQIARRNGTAIGIGHPYRNTLDYLEIALPQLQQQGIEVIPASNLLALQQIRRVELATLAAE
ncbi:MAG: divergent polysaccharide deacetylase family protein [bacterium]